METRFDLTREKKPHSSFLRRKFEFIDGRFTKRDINIDSPVEKMTPLGTSLKELPGSHPNIFIVQIKKFEDKSIYYSFYEKIYTNSEFLNEFEDFLRSNAIPIEAKNHDDVPDKYLKYFNTPYSKHTCDINRKSCSINTGKETIHTPDIETFVGVDFSVPAILNLIEPETLDKKLSEIEKQSNFTVAISTVNMNDIKNSELLMFEHRYGNKFMTVDHFYIINSTS